MGTVFALDFGFWIRALETNSTERLKGRASGAKIRETACNLLGRIRTHRPQGAEIAAGGRARRAERAASAWYLRCRSGTKIARSTHVFGG